MRFATFLLLAVLPLLSWAGPEFWMPQMREGSAYESSDPRYRVVGIEDDGDDHTLFVVADSASVLDQKAANRIIRDIRRRQVAFSNIVFHTSVRDTPRFPAFAIYDMLAVYTPNDNRVHYSVAAKKLYGGWAYGPTPRVAP